MLRCSKKVAFWLLYCSHCVTATNDTEVVPGSRLLREAAPITSNALAELDLTPDSRLYAQVGEQRSSIKFKLHNLDTRSRQFAISVQEHGPAEGVTFPDTPSFEPKLSELRPNLYPNETRILTIFLSIPPTVLLGTKKTYTIEVQPLGTTASGAANMLVRRFHFVIGDIQGLDEDSILPKCKTIERVVSQACLQHAQDFQTCGQHSWRGHLRIQVCDFF